MAARTIYLSRLIGLFTLIVTLSMLADRPQALEMIRTVVQDRPALIILGLLGTAAGLAIVLGHQVWSGGALPVLVTVLGWVFLIRGAVLLYLSPEATAHLVDRFRFEDLFNVYLGLTMALGLYLTVRGFSARFARRPRE